MQSIYQCDVCEDILSVILHKKWLELKLISNLKAKETTRILTKLSYGYDDVVMYRHNLYLLSSKGVNIYQFKEKCEIQCKNGVCIKNFHKEESCICETFWFGKLCEKQVDECESSPCSLKGTLKCIDQLGRYDCKCKPQWNGKHCETINFCYNANCGQGVCVPNPANNETFCSCQLSWMGKTCDRKVISVDGSIASTVANKYLTNKSNGKVFKIGNFIYTLTTTELAVLFNFTLVALHQLPEMSYNAAFYSALKRKLHEKLLVL